MIYLDFESRSRVDIYSVGAWEYSVHPSTEILCLAYAVDDKPIRLLDKVAISRYAWDLSPDDLYCAHNAFYEQCIWQNILVKQHGWPRIPIKQWRCTMAKALACALPAKLEKCAKALNSPVLKDEAGHRVMLKLSKPNSKGEWNENPDDLKKLFDYCKNDVETERAIDNLLPDLNRTEQVYWFLDQLINQRGAYVDTRAVKKALDAVEIHSANLNQLVADVSGGKLDGVSRRMAVLQWCRERDVEINGYTKSDVSAVLTRNAIPDDVRTVLETKLALGKTSVAKYEALHAATHSDGRLRDLLIYHGASTGRWTGKLFQIHNLPKGNLKDSRQAIDFLKNLPFDDFEMLYPDVMGTLSSCLRGMIIASPGHQLFVGDYSAIEARVVMWLAGEEFGLSQFAKGVDLYVDTARIIYGQTAITPAQREVGKRVVLGCGFGMGANKFLSTCLNAGIKIDATLAQRSVDTYRQLYNRVQRSWYSQESAALQTVETGQNHPCGKVWWEYDHPFLFCRLPSDRCIAYPFPSLKYVDTPWGEKKLALHFMAVDSLTKQWKEDHTYGGKLVENITQATARDILAAALWRLECAGYKVLFSVHDEVVAERTDGTIEEFQKLICQTPVWAEGCPIKAESWTGERYHK